METISSNPLNETIRCNVSKSLLTSPRCTVFVISPGELKYRAGGSTETGGHFGNLKFPVMWIVIITTEQLRLCGTAKED